MTVGDLFKALEGIPSETEVWISFELDVTDTDGYEVSDAVCSMVASTHYSSEDKAFYINEDTSD